MNPVDGITLIKHMRDFGSKMPIIMVTGDAAIAPIALRAGANQVLSALEINSTGEALQALLRRR
jgi:FixJ family two-component response regulator